MGIDDDKKQDNEYDIRDVAKIFPDEIDGRVCIIGERGNCK